MITDRQVEDHIMSKNQKDQRRPAIALYRPGVSRLSRRTSPGTHSDQSEESSSGTELSPTKSVRPITSLVIERSDQNVAPHSTGNSGKKEITSDGNNHQSSGIRQKSQIIPPSEDWNKDVSDQPVISAKQVTGAHKDHDARKRNQQGRQAGKPHEQPNRNNRGKVQREYKGSEKRPPNVQQREQPRKQVGQRAAAEISTRGDPRSRGQSGKTGNRRRDPPDKHSRRNETQQGDKSDIITASDAPIGHDGKQKEQLVDKGAKSNARREQLQVEIGREVHEPAEISPTTVELIKTWKGDQADVVITKKPADVHVTVPLKTAMKGESISKGTGPLRTESKTSETSAIYSPKPQRCRDDWKPAQSEEKADNTTSSDTVKDKMTNDDTDDNPAEWDWVKELMNEEPPAEPLFYHGKGVPVNEEIVDQDINKPKAAESNLNAGDSNRSVLPSSESSASKESRIESPFQGKTEVDSRKEEGRDNKDKDNKEMGQGQTNKGTRAEQRDGREVRDDRRPKQEGPITRRTSRESDDTHTKRNERAHKDSDRNQNRKKPHDNHSKQTIETPKREHESNSKQRPERAIYTAPKKTSRSESDQRNGGRRDHRTEKNTSKLDEDDEQADMAPREVEVSPDKEDHLIITVQNQAKKTMDRHDSERGSKRYSSRKSRQRGTSESSTGSESHLVDVSRETESVSEARRKLGRLDIDRRENKSFQKSLPSASSERERSSKGVSRRARQTQDDERGDQTSGRRGHVPQGKSDRTESDREEHLRNKSGKSKHSVQFSQEVHKQRHCSDDSVSDGSDDYSRDRNRDYKSRSDNRDTEARRKHQESKKPAADSPEHHARGGGLLRLPVNVTMETAPRSVPQRTDSRPSDDRSAYSPYYDKHYPAQGQSPSNTADGRHMHHPAQNMTNPSSSTVSEVRHKQDNTRSRGADRSRLWDPSKPQQRPALPERHSETNELQFYDPEENESANPPDQRQPYPYPYPQGYPPQAPQAYYPGYPPVPQQYYPQGYYPPQQPQPPQQGTSWAEQVDSQRRLRTPPPGAYSASAGPSYGHFPPLAAAAASDPYQLSTPQDIQGGLQQPSVHHQSAMRLLREASGIDLELTNLVSRGLRGNDCIDRAISIQ